MFRSAPFVCLAALLMASGCGSDSAVEAQPDLDGSWELVSAADANGPIEFDELTFEVDTEFAVVSARSPCQRVFGSLSFTPAGDSTFTMPGSTTAPCDDDLELVHLRFVDALESVTSWDSTDPGLVLAGPEQVLLSFRPVG